MKLNGSESQIEFISRREGVATGGAMGRLFVTIISAIAELKKSLVVERVKSGMRRAKLGKSGVHGWTSIGSRLSLTVAPECHRPSLQSGTQSAGRSVCRLIKEANGNSQPAVLTADTNLAEQAQAQLFATSP